MKYSQQIIRIAAGFACAALLLWVSACSRTELDGGVGCIAFSIEEDDAVVTKATGDQIYAIDIISEQGDTVAHYDDHRNVQNVWLKEGVYTVCASDNHVNTSEDPFGTPRYGGKESVTIKAGEKAYVVITCTIVNVKVEVKEFDQEIRDNFTDYSLVVKPTYEYTGSDTLTFTQNEVDTEQAGWIDQTSEGSFVIVFRAFNQQSTTKRYTYVKTISGVLPADYYRLTVRMDSSGDPSDGGGLFYLSVQTDTKEYEFRLDVNGQPHALPEVTRADGGSINDPLTTNEGTRDGVIKLNIHADAAMKRLRIRHEDPNVLLKYGLPGMITLGGDHDAATDEEQRSQLANVMTWGEGSIVGRTDTWIDFSNLMNTATLDGVLLPEGDYPVEIEVYDNDNQLITQKITLTVARDFVNGGAMANELINGIPGLGSTYAYVTAQWIADQAPVGLAFEYREAAASDDTWQKVTVKAEDINEEEKSFRALLTGLTPNTQYVFRPVGDNVAVGSAALFTTDAQIEIPNLDFEEGQYGTFDGVDGVYDPNIPGQARFWATGNPGGMYVMVGQGLKKNVTLPVEGSEARTGKALWLTSYYVDKLGVKSLATGTIFSGSFGPISSPPMNTDDQRALVHYGQSYTARPVGLKGWYKYVPKTIDTDIDGKYPDLIGQSDQCKIYISLEKWGTGVTSRPPEPVVVGYGELLSGATSGSDEENGYEPFELKINYTSADKPDHIVMCVTCSYLSDDFCGGAGSSLYIDDFELVWSPDELKSDE